MEVVVSLSDALKKVMQDKLGVGLGCALHSLLIGSICIGILYTEAYGLIWFIEKSFILITVILVTVASLIVAFLKKYLET